jgi:DNA-directed RNA polymerase sigma subunit (sigma70/sigma32)
VAKERVERDEEDLVRLYLTDIGQYPLLTKDDEVRLAQAIEEGKKAGDQLEKGGKDLTAARKRELRKLNKAGEDGFGPPAAGPHPRGQPGPHARGREV